MNAIKSFLDKLKLQQNTPTVTNPYLDDGLANNLRLYLEYMSNIQGKRILLVGEAPGYKGCRITGIPFSSVKVLMSTEHPLFHAIKPQLSFSNDVLNGFELGKMTSENTATVVWQYLVDKKTIPLFWNSFPFHPHPKDKENKNRAPNSKEIAQGIIYLQQPYTIFQPDIIAGVGVKGVECAKKAYPELAIKYIRHPSYGGKSEFIEGMNSIIQ